jgi:hypothetical protein
MKRLFLRSTACLLALVLLMTANTMYPSANPSQPFELPVGGAENQQITWSAGGSGFTAERISQSDGFLYLESSAPLVPQNWGYGLVWQGDFNDWDWNAQSVHEYNISGAIGSNSLALRLSDHPSYAAAMACGNFQITFFSWSLSESAPMSARLTRAYLLIPSAEPTPPTAPRTLATVAGNGQVILSWAAPESNGGSPITRYEVSRSGGAWTSVSMNTNHTFTGLTNGTSYTFRVRAVNSAGNGAEAAVNATPIAGGNGGTPSLTDFIVIDQFGYRPESRKIAVIRNPRRGPDAHLSFNPGNVYQIINEATGVAAFTGSPVYRFEDDANSGDEIWWFDFSSLTQNGRYYVLDVQRNVRSFSFSVAEDVYNEVLKHAVRMFFYQRSGFAKQTPYADPRWTDAAAYMHDTDSRFYLLPNRTDLSRDLHGAWFDAGDYNKYTPWTAEYVEGLISVYRERPEVFAMSFNLPESGNGIPDILNEARWGMDWLLRMQNNNSVDYSALGIPNYPNNITNFDGSVLCIVGYGAAGASPPSLDTASTAPSRYGPPTTYATMSAAKAFALGAIVFEKYDPAYALTLRNAAIRAYNWAVANPEVYFANNADSTNSRGLGAGNQEPAPDGSGISGNNIPGAYDPFIRPRAKTRMHAALYLYELTGDSTYLQPFEQNQQYRTFTLWGWGLHMDAFRFDTHRLYLHYLTLSGASTTIQNTVRTRLNSAFHNATGNYASRTQDCGYLAFMPVYVWGSNNQVSNVGSTFYYFSEQNIVSGTSTVTSHKQAAESFLHYLHGVNPLNMVYLTTMNEYGASRSASAIFHSWFSPWYRTNASTAGPPPGYLPGGPHGGFNVDGVFPQNIGAYGNLPSNHPVRQNMIATGNLIRSMQGSPHMKMYVDTDHTWPINSWEITEPMGAYQLSYIRLLSKFASPPPPQELFQLTINTGSSSGTALHTAGAGVTITAPQESGKVFKEWVFSVPVTFTSGNANSRTVTFIMPASTVTATAVYEDSGNPPTGIRSITGYTGILAVLFVISAALWGGIYMRRRRA